MPNCTHLIGVSAMKPAAGSKDTNLEHGRFLSCSQLEEVTNWIKVRINTCLSH